MKKIILFLFIPAVLALASCSEELEKEKVLEQVTIVYSINNNNLSLDMESNQRQMLAAMKDVDSESYKLLIYRYAGDGPALFRVERDGGGEPELRLVKKYDPSVLSVDPDRVAEVISDVYDIYPDAPANLFFWGHALGWVNPYKYPSSEMARTESGNILESGFSKGYGLLYAFGGEYDPEDSSKMIYCDIDQLASAVPDGRFSTIWFDCCYMGSVEVAYQFRNKCDYFVGYPTEILAEGLPYRNVLTCIMRKTPDLVGAAQSLFEYYNSRNEPVTVAVLDMKNMERVAMAAREVYHTGIKCPSESGLQDYSRIHLARYYDFGQYVRSWSFADDEDRERVTGEFNSAMASLVIYAAASGLNFKWQPIDHSVYSGLSTHYYRGSDVNTRREEYYRSLDWYKAVWPEENASAFE